MINFLHTNIPDAILFKLGPLTVHWYGFLMALGGLLGIFLAARLAKIYGWDKKIIYDGAVWAAVGAIVGARIYYVIYAWPMYRENLGDVFKIWQGGLAVHGVMIGLFAGLWLYCRKRKINFWLFADIAAAALCAGQIIGRNGNYFNQEIFGRPTDLAWGIPIEAASRPPRFFGAEYFHPVFLYEVLGNIIICSVLIYLHARRKTAAAAPFWAKPGVIAAIYLLLYSAMRFGLEFLRVDYSPTIFGVRWPMIFSGILFMFVVVFLIVLSGKRYDKVRRCE